MSLFIQWKFCFHFVLHANANVEKDSALSIYKTLLSVMLMPLGKDKLQGDQSPDCLDLS